ncbi:MULTISPECIES: NUDIX hydrolase [Nocardia]|uniref:NUDIX domain-containing protein n=1 Tax=Nocardia TaxID=1817 RepID=UPI0007A47A2E|nr:MULTISPECIES: NUDIX hydrolase [Nocardia]OBF67051.1 ADP-ribose pyrophosphatase [Mycobacterium sp. 852002-51759_SCH5129042]MBF6277629.1 NUDIX hydrolase [Nocardia nova]MBV7707683.1 NUDIX hydrolase [Nocardia nova]OBA45720.1 ADP-ribose pyrophosphatase [Nocardia sp. 852002-51101_SCH5132738]OBB31495.1 ADP-ribose pyrophosphatase [Nocardia sp. 852002-51244_SCH5132740]
MSEPGNHNFRVVGTETVYSGAIVALRRDQVEMPGGRIAEREVVEHHGAVAIVALDHDGSVVLINQYRHPIGRRLLELPAGLLDQAGEDPLAAAQRELAEETGLAAREWSTLVDVVLSPGFTDEALRIYLATGLSDTDRPDPEHEEADLSIVRMSLQDAVTAALSGRIENATAVAGVLAASVARANGTTLRPADAPWPGMPTQLLDRKAAEHARA